MKPQDIHIGRTYCNKSGRKQRTVRSVMTISEHQKAFGRFRFYSLRVLSLDTLLVGYTTPEQDIPTFLTRESFASWAHKEVENGR